MKQFDPNAVGEMEHDGQWREVRSLHLEMIDAGPAGNVPMFFVEFADDPIGFSEAVPAHPFPRSRPKEGRELFPEASWQQRRRGLSPEDIFADPASSTFGTPVPGGHRRPAPMDL